MCYAVQILYHVYCVRRSVVGDLHLNHRIVVRRVRVRSGKCLLASSCPSVLVHVQGDQKVSVHLIITIQKLQSNVQSVLHQSPDRWSLDLH
jgi:hypothetical protein